MSDEIEFVGERVAGSNNERMIRFVQSPEFEGLLRDYSYLWSSPLPAGVSLRYVGQVIPEGWSVDPSEPAEMNAAGEQVRWIRKDP